MTKMRSEKISEKKCAKTSKEHKDFNTNILRRLRKILRGPVFLRPPLLETLLSAHVERFSFSGMQDLVCLTWNYRKYINQQYKILASFTCNFDDHIYHSALRVLVELGEL